MKCSTTDLQTLKQTENSQKILDKYLASESSSASTSTVDETTIWGLLQNNYKQLLSGLGITLALALISFAIAIVIGIIFGMFSVSPYKSLRVISEIFVDVIRWYSIDDSCSLYLLGEFQTSSSLSQANKVQLTTS